MLTIAPLTDHVVRSEKFKDIRVVPAAELVLFPSRTDASECRRFYVGRKLLCILQWLI